MFYCCIEISFFGCKFLFFDVFESGVVWCNYVVLGVYFYVYIVDGYLAFYV